MICLTRLYASCAIIMVRCSTTANREGGEMAEFTYGELGSISSGTMRTEDLIPEFLYTLEHLAKLNKRKDHIAIVKRISKDSEREGYYDSEESSWDLNEDLFNALNEYAAPYCYFGANEGDGADFGFWLSCDFQQEIRDNDGLEVADLAEVPKGYTGEVLHVNDHGNATLYTVKRGKFHEIWAVV